MFSVWRRNLTFKYCVGVFEASSYGVRLEQIRDLCVTARIAYICHCETNAEYYR